MGQQNPNHQFIGGKHPIIFLGVSTCFNHPFGDAGFRNHPLYLMVSHGTYATPVETGVGECPILGILDITL